MTDSDQKERKIWEFLGKLRFTTKLRLHMMFLVIGMSLLFLSFFVYHTRNTGKRELKKQGIILAQDLAWECELGVLANDSRYLQLPLKANFRRDNVVYIMIYGRAGDLMMGKNKLPPAAPPVGELFDNIMMGELRIRNFSEFPVYEFNLPIITMEKEESLYDLLFELDDMLSQADESKKSHTPLQLEDSLEETGKKRVIGYVRLGLSLSQVETSINKIIRHGLYVTALFLFLGIITTYFWARILTSPIVTLTEGVKAIIGGNLTQHISVRTNDEFAELAGAFNKMSLRLRKRMEEIRQKNEELEDFAHTVSHDLKAPLISIQGFSSMLRKKHEKGLDEKGQFYVERIQKNVERMDLLIHDLLQLSRIGRVKMVVEPVKTDKIIVEIIEEISPQIKEKNIQLAIADKLPVIYGDRTSLYHIFSNLINNAIKFTGDNAKPKVEITWKKIDGNYEFVVKDNGIGIEKQYHERIFGMFQRLDNSTAGTGVGLAIVKRLVEKEGGEVCLESEPGKGAAFYITLPGKKFQQL